LLGRLEAAAEAALKLPPAAAFEALLAPLSGTKFDARAACTALDQVLQLVGKPDAVLPEPLPGRLTQALLEVARALSAECEAQLGELLQALAARADPGEPEPAGAQPLFAGGTRDVDAAADAFLAALPPDETLAFDARLQDAIRKHFQALVRVCLDGPGALGPL